MLLNLHQNLIEVFKKTIKVKRNSKEIILKLMCFYFNQFLHNFSNLILIKFKGVEVHYLYVYQTNFIKKNSYELFFTFHSDMKPCDT